MNLTLVSHTENFEKNRDKIEWLIKEIEKLEKKFKQKISINWMLEEDDTKPYQFEIRGNNEGDLISKGGIFFKKEILDKRKQDELGIHIHFIKNNRFDVSEKTQRELIHKSREKFEKMFGISPKSFVGGWWHSDRNTLKILREEGFKVDASPMPLYREKRRCWINVKGKLILNPFKKKVLCDWTNFKKREPFIKEGILIVPNSINPKLKKLNQKLLNFPNTSGIYLDDIDLKKNDFVKIFKEFKDKKIDSITIPFHPHSIDEKKIKSFEEFLIDINNIDKIKFLRLREIKMKK